MFNIESVYDYVQGLNYKEMIRLQLTYFIGFFLIVSLLIYRNFNLLAEAQQKTKILNKARRDVQVILTEYDHTKKKMHEVDILLTKDKNFYIQKYYKDTVDTLDIMNQKASNLVSQTWPNGYIEESLPINFTAINMKQLCNFLEAIQENTRVFIKKLDISKSPVDKKINVSLVIATLQLVIEKNK